MNDRKDARKVWDRRYYEKNRERLLEYNREWARTNPQKVREKAQRYIERHPDRVAARHARYGKDNRDKKRDYERLRYQTDEDYRVKRRFVATRYELAQRLGIAVGEVPDIAVEATMALRRVRQETRRRK